MSRINKILFLIHHPLMLSHYRNIWTHLPNKIYDVLLTHDAEKPFSIASKLIHMGLLPDQIVLSENYYKKIIPYKMSVSNHVITKVAGSTGSWAKYLPEACSEIKVRCMYGADIDTKWSLMDWNSVYDYCLCHGPFDAYAIQHLFKIETFQMGYPKHDNFWVNGGKSDCNEREAEGYVLWMPSFNLDIKEWSSLDEWQTVLALLGNRKVICRPHPMMVKSRGDILNSLISKGVPVDLDSSRDTSSLFRNASHVLTDFGGSIFVSLYCKKPFLILRKGPLDSWEAFSSIHRLVSELGECYVDISKSDKITFSQLLDSAEDLSHQTRVRETFFTTTNGYDGHKAALYLLKIFLEH